MSDVATTPAVAPEAAPVQAPVAPAEAPATEPLGAPAAAPETRTPMTYREAFGNLKTPREVTQPAAPVETPAVVEDATGRLHGQDGKFVEKPVGESSPAPTGEPAASAPETAPTPKNEAAATPGVPEGFVQIPLPENHPLRARGRTHVLAPVEAESDYRGFINLADRRAQEASAATTALQEREQQLDLHRAALRAANEFNALVFADPRISQTYWQISEDHGPEAASRWLDGLAADHGKNAEQYVTQAQQERQAQQHQAAATRFLGDANTKGREMFRLWSDDEYTKALQGYAGYAASTGEDLSLESFKEFALPFYVKHPTVAQQLEAYRRQKQENQATAERQTAAERERQALATAQQTVQNQSPLNTLPQSIGTGHEAPRPAAPKLTYREAKAALRSPRG